MRPLLLDLARLFTAVYLVTMMFSMGLELGGAPHETREAKRHQRRLLARALVFNLVLLPLIAVALTKVLHSSGEVTIGFLLAAAAPGGRFTPQLSRLSGAHLGFSVELTLLIVKVVSFTAPLTVHWMLNTRPLAVHELRFIAQLIVLQLAPYLAGREVRKRWPLVAQRLGRFSEVVMWMGFGIVLGLVIAAYPLRNLPTLLGERAGGLPSHLPTLPLRSAGSSAGPHLKCAAPSPSVRTLAISRLRSFSRASLLRPQRASCDVLCLALLADSRLRLLETGRYVPMAPREDFTTWSN
jgi:hypothetical protein